MTETSIAESRTADAGVAARYQEPSSAWRWVARVAVLLPIVSSQAGEVSAVHLAEGDLVGFGAPVLTLMVEP